MVAGRGIRLRRSHFLPAGIVIFFIASCLLEMPGEHCVPDLDMSSSDFSRLTVAKGKPSGVYI